jgi:hypothetical protein
MKPHEKNQPKQRNTRTKKCECPWHINLTFPERATHITISLFVNQHNHELRPTHSPYTKSKPKTIPKKENVSNVSKQRKEMKLAKKNKTTLQC